MLLLLFLTQAVRWINIACLVRSFYVMVAREQGQKKERREANDTVISLLAFSNIFRNFLYYVIWVSVN